MKFCHEKNTFLLADGELFYFKNKYQSLLTIDEDSTLC